MIVELDDLDVRILDEIQRDSRQTITEIARKLGKPRTTVASRLERLAKMGVIKRYSAVLNHHSLGYSLTAFILLTARRGGRRGQYQLAREVIQLCDQDEGVWVEEAGIVAGRYDIIFKVKARSLNDLTKLLIDYLPNFDEVERSETFIVLQTIDEYRPLNLAKQGRK